MGTRADFYIGRGEHAEWLGSIAWSSSPRDLATRQPGLLRASSVDDYRQQVAELLAGREDATTPDMGWPWPWPDSSATEYAYAFDYERVYAAASGGTWFMPTTDEPVPGNDTRIHSAFPDMSHRAQVTFGVRSGLLVPTRCVPRRPTQGSGR